MHSERPESPKRVGEPAPLSSERRLQGAQVPVDASLPMLDGLDLDLPEAETKIESAPLGLGSPPGGEGELQGQSPASPPSAALHEAPSTPSLSERQASSTPSLPERQASSTPLLPERQASSTPLLSEHEGSSTSSEHAVSPSAAKRAGSMGKEAVARLQSAFGRGLSATGLDEQARKLRERGRALADRDPFWAQVGPGFAMPFTGTGVLWFPLLIAVFVLACIPSGSAPELVLALSFLSLLATYFVRSLSQGLAGEPSAPSIYLPSHLYHELVYPGIILFGLAIFTWGPLLYTASPTLEKEEEVPTWVEPLESNNQFLDQDGNLISVGEEDEPQLLRRPDGRFAHVWPKEGIVREYPTGWKPEASSNSGITPFPYFVVSIWTLLALMYWPMALAASALTEDWRQGLNPIQVAKYCMRDLKCYAFIAAIGPLAALLILTRFALVAPDEGAVLWVLVSLCAFIYALGVQGFLLGSLLSVAERDYPELNLNR